MTDIDAVALVEEALRGVFPKQAGYLNQQLFHIAVEAGLKGDEEPFDPRYGGQDLSVLEIAWLLCQAACFAKYCIEIYRGLKKDGKNTDAQELASMANEGWKPPNPPSQVRGTIEDQLTPKARQEIAAVIILRI